MDKFLKRVLCCLLAFLFLMFGISVSPYGDSFEYHLEEYFDRPSYGDVIEIPSDEWPIEYVNPKQSSEGMIYNISPAELKTGHIADGAKLVYLDTVKRGEQIYYLMRYLHNIGQNVDYSDYYGRTEVQEWCPDKGMVLIHSEKVSYYIRIAERQAEFTREKKKALRKSTQVAERFKNDLNEKVANALKGIIK